MPPSNLETKIMMALYNDVVQTIPTMFLSGLFGKNPLELVFSPNEKVEVDVKRNDENIAIDVTRGGDGNKNTAPRHSTKEYAPPLYDEVTPITARQLNRRLAGQNTFEQISPEEKFAVIATEVMLKQTQKIQRAMEKQAAEIFFDGVVNLVNTESLDFKRKSTHNLTPANLWSDLVDGNPIADLQTVSQFNRIDGKMPPNMAVFGSAAWDAFLIHPRVLTYLDNRRINPGEITPRFAADGATFQGVIWVGDYRLEIFTYPQFFTDESGTELPYVPTDQVAVFNGDARLNKAFAANEILPEFMGIDSEISQLPSFLPGREIVPYSYTRAPKSRYVGVQSSVVLVPVAIDTISNINVL